MSKIILLLLFALAVINHAAYSQNKSEKPFKKRFSLSVGMGISTSTAPSYIQYIRDDLPIVNRDSIKSFGIGFEFFGSVEYDVSEAFSLKLDYSYFTKDLSVDYTYFTYDYFFYIHQPYLMGFYNFRKKGYGFKFGAGLGYNCAQTTKDIGAGSLLKYHTSGVGYRGEILVYSMISKHLGAYISGNLIGRTTGTLKDSDGNVLKNPDNGNDVDLGGFGIGLRLGISYYFN